MTAGEIDVLPIVGGPDQGWAAGWVSYDNTVVDSPDVEIFCGGVNDKSSIGAAVWRQGGLLHFGFEQSPRQMNDTGRALLVNAIAYIARFHEDRAICRAPSPFAGGARARSALEGWLANEEFPLEFFTASFAPGLLDGVANDRAACREWFRAHRDWLHPGSDGRLALDEDAKALGLGFDRLECLEQAVAFLAEGGAGAGHAKALLARYVPEGPGEGASAEAWRTWLAANRAFLFFSEWGGYLWYVDPLAKKRGVPSAELKGPARADE